MREPQRSQGYLLKTTAFGESDQILAFYTRGHGQLRGMARGARRSRKRFGGALDYFHLVRVHYQLGRGDLAEIADLEILKRSDRIAKDLRAYAYGSYFLELVRELTHPHEPEPMIFDLLACVIRRLEEGVADHELAVASLARFFEMNLLCTLGFRPELDVCVSCREKIAGNHAMHDFAVREGGILCSNCRQHGGALPRLSQEARSLLQRFRLDPSDSEPGPLVDLPVEWPMTTETNQLLERVLRDLLQTHLPRPLQTLEFLREMTAPVDNYPVCR